MKSNAPAFIALIAMGTSALPVIMIAGKMMTVILELLKQFEPAHSRQIGVDQQARGFVGMKAVKKRLAAWIGVDDAAIVFEHCAYRLANLVVIIDDDDPGSARSAQRQRQRGEEVRRCGSGGLARSFSIAHVNSPSLTGLLR